MPIDRLEADVLTTASPQVKVAQHRQQILGQLRILPRTNGKI